LDSTIVDSAAGAGWDAYQADHFRFVADQSVDLILTDPPFNIARDTNFHTYENNTINSYRFDKDKGWDSYSREHFVSLLQSWAREFNRVLRKGGSFAIFCADQYISDLHHALEDAGLSPRRTITWRKPNAVPVNRSVMMMSSCEFIVTGVKAHKAVFNADVSDSTPELAEHLEALLVADKVSTVIELLLRRALAETSWKDGSRPEQVARVVEDVLARAQPEVRRRVKKMYRVTDGHVKLEGCVPNFVNFNSKSGRRLHPTEKPLDLLTFLVSLLSVCDSQVLDPFSGSASTGVAALSLGRRVTLIESDPEFFTKGIARLRTHSTQTTLGVG
jgi:DNA modification methylase